MWIPHNPSPDYSGIANNFRIFTSSLGFTILMSVLFLKFSIIFPKLNCLQVCKLAGCLHSGLCAHLYDVIFHLNCMHVISARMAVCFNLLSFIVFLSSAFHLLIYSSQPYTPKTSIYSPSGLVRSWSFPFSLNSWINLITGKPRGDHVTVLFRCY